MDPKDTKPDPLRAAYDKAFSSNPAAIAPEVVRAYHQRELAETVSRTVTSTAATLAIAAGGVPVAARAALSTAEESAGRVLVGAEAAAARASRDAVQAAEAAALRIVSHAARETRNAALAVIGAIGVVQVALWILGHFAP